MNAKQFVAIMEYATINNCKFESFTEVIENVKTNAKSKGKSLDEYLEEYYEHYRERCNKVYQYQSFQ